MQLPTLQQYKKKIMLTIWGFPHWCVCMHGFTTVCYWEIPVLYNPKHRPVFESPGSLLFLVTETVRSVLTPAGLSGEVRLPPSGQPHPWCRRDSLSCQVSHEEKSPPPVIDLTFHEKPLGLHFSSHPALPFTCSRSVTSFSGFHFGLNLAYIAAQCEVLT